MPTLKIISRGGSQREINAATGITIMEALRDNGVDEVLALCGGCLSCATCHVYIDPAFAAILPPLSDGENEMLDCSSYRTEHSRLSCQLPVTSDLEGMVVTIAQED